MDNIVSLIEGLKKKFTSKPASQIEIVTAENELHLQFSEEYKIFLLSFGGLMYNGEEIIGVGGCADTVTYTKSLRQEVPTLPHNMYVVSNLGIDNMFMLQNQEGKIYEYSPGAGIKERYNSLSDYIRKM